tara:strand:+ start:11912 stop:13141 length:1230 start_codon:yes stop_codon:yes gene_type:complete
LISKLEKKITLRYLRTRKSDGFINIISIFSFIGISLGVAVLIIVMSVMNGFRTELISKIIGSNPHIIVKSYQNDINLKKIENLKKLKKIEKILISADGQAVIVNKNYTKGIQLRGYKKNSFQNLDLVKNKTFEGNKKLNHKHISIGKELSYNLNVNIGDKIVLMSPSGIESIVGTLPKQDTFIIDSIFESGLIEFDNNVAFININDLQGFMNLKENEKSIEIFLNNPNNVNQLKEIISNIFVDSFIYTWNDLNKSLFSALKIERNVMFIILSLIIIVAAFNIISGLTILVKNKTKDIAILKSIGVKNFSIMKIFFLVGLSIGLLATVFGIFLGVVFSIYVEEIRMLISEIFNIKIFPEEIYFLSKMPYEINFKSIGIIGIISILITIVVSIYPAFKAAKLDPIKSLKHE